MDEWKFAVVTFEHDIYTGNHYNTREKSRAIFKRRGYVRVFSDVTNERNPYEDWYVYPDLVDMNLVARHMTDKSMEWTQIVSLLKQ